jgi:hypothetical protein
MENREDDYRRGSLFEDAIGRIQNSADEVAALKLALSECSSFPEE